MLIIIKFQVKRLLNINKKITSNETKYIEADKKLTDLTKKLLKYQAKDIIFCKVECILQAMMAIKIIRSND